MKAGNTWSLFDATKALFRSEKPDPAKAARQFVDSMNQMQIEIEDEYDAFLLDPGMGPMTYLTSDGRVLLDFRSWDGDAIREASGLDEEIASIVVGAKKTGISELVSLVPEAPTDTEECPQCLGRRWAEIVPDCGTLIVCILCSGRGWASPPMVAAAKERGILW